jgi:prophage regulatory protein
MPILRMPEVKAETGLRSHASVYTAVHDGLFTVPVSIGQRAVGWPDHEVKAINAARIAGKSDDQIRELVDKLHSARMTGTNEAFKTDWFDRSASLKKQAAQRKGHTKALGTTTGVAA